MATGSSTTIVIIQTSGDTSLVTAAALAIGSRYKPDQLKRAIEMVERGAITRTTRAASTNYWATASNGTDRYLVDPVNGECSCRAGQNERRCYHLAAADIAVAIAQLTEEH